MRLAFRVFAAIAILGVDARAEERPRVRLEYDVPHGVSCPDESSVRKLVGARLGYDPFASEAERVVTLSILKDGRSLKGRVQMREGAGSPGSRELSSPSGDCEELVSSLAMTIAVGIDPLGFAGPAPPQEPPPPTPAADPEPPVEDRPSPAPRPVQDARSSPRLRAHAGPIVSVGALPSVGMGLSLGAGARWRTFSVGAEGRVDLPAASKEAPRGEISASLLAGSIVPCFHLGVGRACLVATAGALRAAGEGVAAPKQSTQPFASLGARAGIEVPLGDTVAVGAHGDLNAALTRITLRLDDRDVWSSPSLSGALGMDVLGTF